MDPVEKHSLGLKFGEVFTLQFKGGGELIFRSPKRNEIRTYLEVFDEPCNAKELFIFDRLILESDGYKDERLIGDIIKFHDIVVPFFGIGDIEFMTSMLEISRNELSLADNQFAALILKAFPGKTLRDIDDMTYMEFTRMSAMAEFVTGMKIEVQVPKQAPKQTQAQKILNSMPEYLPEDCSIDFSAENNELNGD